MSILDVHDLVADIIGCLDKIHQRMTGVFQWLSHLRLADNTEFVGNPAIVILLRLKESELPLFARGCGGERVFDDAGQS